MDPLREPGVLIDGIYAAVAGPDSLHATLDLVAGAFDARSAVLLAFDRSAHRSSISAMTEFSAEELRRYHEHYWQLDEWRIGAERIEMRVDDFVPDTAFMSHARFAESPIWNEFLKPLDRFQWMGGFLDRAERYEAIIGVHRGRHQPEFGTEEVARMKQLAPHLRHTLRAIRRLQRHDAWGALFQSLGDRLALGVIGLGADARVVSMNPCAEAILAARDGLDATPRGLSASRIAGKHQLEARIADATRTALGTSSAGGSTLRLPRPSGRRDYVLDIIPVTSPPAVYPHERVAAVVLITDPEREESSLPQRLQQVLGLSVRESRLAAALGSGQSLGAAAPALGLTVGTARTYLKHVFQKTGTHRQSELVALIRRLAAVNPVQRPR